MEMHIPFELLLDRAAGRTAPVDEAHLRECGGCREAFEAARRLVAAGRRALAEHGPGRRAMARAMRLFREGAGKTRIALRPVLDSLLAPAPALRSGSRAPSRFLRFEGPAVVELQVSGGPGGTELRGQVTPRDFAAEVTLTAGRVRRRAAVEPDGTFLFLRAPKGPVRLLVGRAMIDGLSL
jgi:hypothetical protein